MGEYTKALANLFSKAVNNVVLAAYIFHLKETKNIISCEALRENLLKYRKEESKKRNYPAYYIFTNEQLEKLLMVQPKTIDELKTILEPIKIKIYGDDIINIIKK